ncbi:fibronectin type III domain-containing protein [Cohnella ginsengisoli]|uniref:Fibronectin type III domain-containing protein n=1 Tax=Cohnella ginsengisoli TaxID=425004 RepID=A0A9X4KL19_9BACL|nr:fibronectin type III domain-containing protein [Cohnella ginsengisoli]MDG0794187.1 fibronectin type III domain-containing protein [Cohnella ginsengisoli]
MRAKRRGIISRGYSPPLYPIVDDNVRVTPDGRFAAFIEYKFVGGELHSTLELYDRETGSLEALLQDAEAKEPLSFEMSADARWFAYTGKQRFSDMVDAQVYLYDRQTKENRLVSAQPDGLPGTEQSENPSVSADGRYVAFESSAPGLVEGDTDNYDVFVYDRETNVIEMVSKAVIAEDSVEISYANSNKPSISADGRYVAFESDSAFLTEGDTNGTTDVFLHDRTDKTNRLVSLPASGGQSAEASGNPKISGDGGVVAFESEGALVGEDTNGVTDVYVYRTADGSVKRVSVNTDGAQFDYESDEPLVTADGRYVTFDTLPESVELDQAMIADLAAGVTREVSVAPSEETLTLPLTHLALSDGATVGIFNAGYTYTDSDSGEEIPMSGLFIASKVKGDGGTPTWPDGSKLEASGLQPDRATLTWTPASAAGGIKEYRLYANNERIAVVNGTALTYTAEGLKPATEYVFRIEAANADDVATAGGPSVRVTTPAGDRTLALGLTFDRLSPKRQPVPDSTLTIEARAVTGRAIAAKIVYATWLAEDGSRLPAPRAAEASVDLTEAASGTGVYTGAFHVEEGISELSKVTAVMTGAAGGPVEKEATGLPLAVSGNLKIAFDNPGGMDLNGVYLSATSAESGGYAVKTLTGEDDVLLEGLKPSDAYAVTLVSPAGKVLGRASSVHVTSGWRTDLSLKVIQPARYRYKVTDEEGKALAGMHIETWDEAGAYVLGGYDTDSNGETSWTGVDDSDKKYTAKVDLNEMSYEPMTPVPFSLKGGDNVIPLVLTRSPQGQLQGKVLDPGGKPVFNALVTTTQMYKGKPVVQQAYTDLNGAYRLTAYEGEVAVQAAQNAYHYNSEPGLKASVAKGKTTTLDIPVAMAPTGMVTFKVHVKMIGSEWAGPVDMEQVRFSASLRGRFGGRISYYQNAVNLQGSPGEKVEVCITGVLSSAFQACKDIVLDNDANGTAEVWVEEAGGLITGKVDADSNTWTFATLYEVTGSGLVNREYKTFRGDHFLLHAPKAGTYRIELTRWNSQTNSQWTASRQVTIAEQETLELGLFELAPAAYFAQRETNGLIAEPNEVSPGGTVNLKAFYQNGDAGALTGATMKIDLPEGISPVGASGGNVPVKVNGTNATAQLNGRSLSVTLGAVGKKAQGTVSLQARLDADYAQDKARLSARIEGTADAGTVSETIGTVQLEVPRVTLEAPDIVTASGVQVIGLAPALSTVKIYDEDLLLGTATATSAGTWRAKVDLRNESASDIHLLWAEAKSGSRTLRSDRELVAYKAGEPVLRELALAQYPNGKWLQLNVENGIAQLPYTVVPGNPFSLVLKFSDPDKVKNVKLYMGGQIGGPVTAEKGDDGLYRATIPTGSGTLGGLYVDYDTVKPKVVISREAPTEAETNALLPPEDEDVSYRRQAAVQAGRQRIRGQRGHRVPRGEPYAHRGKRADRSDADILHADGGGDRGSRGDWHSPVQRDP